MGRSLCATVVAVLGVSVPAASQTAASDPLTADLLGSWIGEGVYEGNRLDLKREWSLALGGQFLSVEMGVLMPNGASFNSLAYWRPEDPGAVRVRRVPDR